MNPEIEQGLVNVHPEEVAMHVLQELPVSTELPTSNRRNELLGQRRLRRLFGRAALAVCVMVGASASEALTDEDAASAQAASGGYPYAGVADCSGQFGIYAWCVDENRNGSFNPGEDMSERGFGYRNCTDWAAFREAQLTGKVVPFGTAMGNANTWDDNGRNIPGATVDGVPEPGDIAQSNFGSLGHVGIVEGVSRDAAGTVTSISISEYNKAGQGEFSTANYSRDAAGIFWRNKATGARWDTFIDLNGPSTPAPAQPAVRKIPGDYDGNGRPEPAVYRPSKGEWHIQGQGVVPYGLPGDIPVPGFWDGDNTYDEAVYRPSTGQWHIRGGPSVQFGANGDIPVPADYTGDGITDIAVYRPSTGEWHIRGVGVIPYGLAEDIPVPADFNGDKKADLAVYRPSTGNWHVRGVADVPYGQSGDIPIPADYDGNGTDDIAVFRPSDGYWHIRSAESSQYGLAGDVPVPADFYVDKRADIAVYRRSTGQWYRRGQETTNFGLPEDIPVTAMQNRAVLKQYGLVQ